MVDYIQKAGRYLSIAFHTDLFEAYSVILAVQKLYENWPFTSIDSFIYGLGQVCLSEEIFKENGQD